MIDKDGYSMVSEDAESPSDSTLTSQKKRALKLNSILNDRTQRILKPCEARAGHGVIQLVIVLAVTTITLMVLARLIYRVYQWIIS